MVFEAAAREAKTYEAPYLKALGTRAATDPLPAQLLNELRAFLRSLPDTPAFAPHRARAELADAELLAFCRTATDRLLTEWRAREIHPADRAAVELFYRETPLYCYELIAFEIDTPVERQRLLGDLVQLLKAPARGCDFGSGVGTLGLYLNRNGLACDFADVSALNLEFVRQRLERRGLGGAPGDANAPRRIDLNHEALTPATYDFITCFDVLEHAVDPIGLMRQMVAALRPGGLLIYNVLIEEEDNTPHLLRDPNLIRAAVRGLGLRKLGTMNEFKIYEKVTRPAVLNQAIRAFDRAFWSTREALRGWARAGR